jgi:hypothetical protein
VIGAPLYRRRVAPASVKNWINLSYAAIWAMHDWHFKHVKGREPVGDGW